jgi:GrpB-like predicted nucleotidyltransferase (UPF0157 family)
MITVAREVGRLLPVEWIGQAVHVVMDRPLGSSHPSHGYRYELNYGYVPGLIAPDGEELDAYVVGAREPLEQCDGVVVAVVLRRDDVEDKLVVSIGGTWDAASIATAVHFQERFFDSEVVTEGMGVDPVDAGAWYRPARVHVEEYDARWPEMYRDEALRIGAAIGDDLVAIEHVGSTAVPGLPAKPIIDILVAVATRADLGDLITTLGELGYAYTPESEADDPDRRVFRKGPTDMSSLRTHHLHVTEPESFYWRRIIAFRDHLRSDPSDAAAYARLKEELIAEFARDSRGYTAAKQEFVTAIERKRGVTP